MKKYVPLLYVINKHTVDPMFCMFETRPKKYKFGVHNYGDIPFLYNKADGDPWDVFAPGYTKALPVNKPIQIEKVLGVFHLENGNHKIAVYVGPNGYNKNRVQKDIEKYCMNYTKGTCVHGYFQYI